MAELWMFVATLAVAYLVPGPDMVLVLRTGMAWGRGHALAAAAGLAVARATHVTLAACGLAALFRTATWTFDAVRVVGALYLLWLAVAISRTPLLAPQGVGEGHSAARSYLAAGGQGLLTNLLNPKALLFSSVLLPQFVHQDAQGLATQFMTLGGVLVGVGVVFDAAYAGTGALLCRWMAGRRWMDLVQRALFAGLLAAFAVRLAMC